MVARKNKVTKIITYLQSIRKGEDSCPLLMLEQAIDILKEYKKGLKHEKGLKHYKPYEPCSVCDQFCEAAANFDCIGPEDSAKYECYSCGRAVCGKCSSIRIDKRKYAIGDKGYWATVRLCNDCQIEMDGDNRVVMRRIYHLAGYKGKPT